MRKAREFGVGEPRVAERAALRGWAHGGFFGRGRSLRGFLKSRKSSPWPTTTPTTKEPTREGHRDHPEFRGKGKRMKALTEAAGFVSSGIAGAVIGAELIKASGYKAAGMTGGGSGIGGKALPVGVAFGTMAGMSLWGLGRTVRAVYVDARAHLRQSPAQEPEGPQIEPEESEE